MMPKRDATLTAEPEGEPQYLSWNLNPAEADLSMTEQAILQSLGAAVVTEWNHIPQILQKHLFQQATKSEAQEGVTPLKSAIAQFLHHHKGPHLPR